MPTLLKGGLLTIADPTDPRARRKTVPVLMVDQLWCNPIHLGPDVTVRDVFRMLHRNPDFWFGIFTGGPVQEIVNEGLRRGPSNPRSVEVAQLTWQPLINGAGDADRPAFRGPLAEMDFDGDGYAFDFMPANAVGSLPLVIHPTVRVVDLRRGKHGRTVARFDCQPSLGTVVHSILRELLFWGPPKERDKDAAAMRRSMRGTHAIPVAELGQHLGLDEDNPPA
jgi:hypothetical protein